MLKEYFTLEALFNSEPWLIKIAIILAIFFFLNAVTQIILTQFNKATKKTKSFLDDAFLSAAKTPVSFLFHLTALKLSFDVITKEFASKTFVEANLALKIAIILNIAWFLLRAVKSISQNYIDAGQIAGKDADHTTIDAVSKLARLIVFVIAALTIMQTIGFNISGLLAAGGVGGLVIGLAAKDMIANLFGGLTIYMDRPFNVGDWVRCAEKNVEGTVEYIGWRHTRLRSFSKNPIYVPNAVFTTVVVENPSRMTNRRIKELVGLRYCDMDKMKSVTDEVRAMLDAHPDIDQSQKRIIKLATFGDSSINFTVTAYTKTTDWEEFSGIKQDILLKVAEIVTKNGADMAFPTRTIYVNEE